MNSHYDIPSPALRRAAVGVFVGVLVLNGTYFRSRSAVDVPTMDWLVLGRLLACTAAAGVGLLLVRYSLPLGFGARMLLLYGSACVLSTIRCPHGITSLGYCILLLGAGLLTVVLVYTARDLRQLRRIEWVWFLTAAALLVKDAFISLWAGAAVSDTGVTRLGMGITHPVEMSLTAAILFWLSFTKDRDGRLASLVGIWLLRAVFVGVLLAARTRTSILAFVFAGILRSILNDRDPVRRLVAVGAAVGTISTFALLNLYSNQVWARDAVDYLRRGQDTAGLSTFTGRTYIWKHAIPKTLETPILGHGYGVSRLTMGRPQDAGFQPQHCHNALLEAFFSTGLLGLTFLAAMMVYSMKWMIPDCGLRRAFGGDLTTHAICALAVLFVASLLESTLAVKVTLLHPLFFFYLAALDRRRSLMHRPASGD